jgi:hypothetical protein
MEEKNTSIYTLVQKKYFAHCRGWPFLFACCLGLSTYQSQEFRRKKGILCRWEENQRPTNPQFKDTIGICIREHGLEQAYRQNHFLHPTDLFYGICQRTIFLVFGNREIDIMIKRHLPYINGYLILTIIDEVRCNLIFWRPNTPKVLKWIRSGKISISRSWQSFC